MFASLVVLRYRVLGSANKQAVMKNVYPDFSSFFLRAGIAKSCTHNLDMIPKPFDHSYNDMLSISFIIGRHATEFMLQTALHIGRVGVSKDTRKVT